MPCSLHFYQAGYGLTFSALQRSVAVLGSAALPTCCILENLATRGDTQRLRKPSLLHEAESFCESIEYLMGIRVSFGLISTQ